MLVNGSASDQMWVCLALVRAQMSERAGNGNEKKLWTQTVRWMHKWGERGVKDNLYRRFAWRGWGRGKVVMVGIVMKNRTGLDD